MRGSTGSTAIFFCFDPMFCQILETERTLSNPDIEWFWCAESRCLHWAPQTGFCQLSITVCSGTITSGVFVSCNRGMNTNSYRSEALTLTPMRWVSPKIDPLQTVYVSTKWLYYLIFCSINPGLHLEGTKSNMGRSKCETPKDQIMVSPENGHRENIHSVQK